MFFKRLFKRNGVKDRNKVLLNDFEFSVVWINGELNPMLKEVSKKIWTIYSDGKCEEITEYTNYNNNSVGVFTLEEDKSFEGMPLNDKKISEYCFKFDEDEFTEIKENIALFVSLPKNNNSMRLYDGDRYGYRLTVDNKLIKEFFGFPDEMCLKNINNILQRTHMQLVRCEKGHFYDLNEHEQCPFFTGNEKVPNSAHSDNKYMNVIKCANGHFYDSNRYSSCPICSSEEKIHSSNNDINMISIVYASPEFRSPECSEKEQYPFNNRTSKDSQEDSFCNEVYASPNFFK